MTGTVKQMKLTKLLDLDALQVYHVQNPSKRFKEKYPKKFTYSLAYGNKQIIMNLDRLIPGVVGYIFAYSINKSELDRLKKLSANRYQDLGYTFSRCLDIHFVDSTDEDVDLILACSPKNTEVPCKFISEIIVKTSSERLLRDPKEFLTSVVTRHLKDLEDLTVERFAMKVIAELPTNDNMLPVKYPKEITERSVNHVKVCSFFVEYDLRAKSYEHENEFVIGLEAAFEPDQDIEIVENYNRIVSRVKSALDKNKLPYKLSNGVLTTKLSHLRTAESKGDISYTLTDFL